MTTELAVIMSIYKNDRLCFLKKSVESILNQSYFNFVFYIQFDGIIDEECENYLLSLTDERIKLNVRSENRGLAYSLNELLKIALNENFEYIARMDADDISSLDRFFKQVTFLKEYSNIDCLGTWAIEIDEESNEYYRKKMPSSHKDCLEMFKVRDCLIHPTVMFRNSFFKKAGLYPIDTYFGEDTIMWGNGFINGCVFANLPEFLLYFRIDKNFFNRRKGLKHAKSIFNLRVRVNRLLGFGFKSDFYAVLYFTIKLLPSSLLNIVYKYFR
jgi:glycosyltransferase involved in cell wall biosynthesis